MYSAGTGYRVLACAFKHYQQILDLVVSQPNCNKPLAYVPEKN